MEKKNKSILFYENGKPDVLKVVETDIPVPKDNEVLVKMEYVGLNRGDIYVRDGTFGMGITFPSGIGCEGSGIVECVGSKVTKFKKGDRVSSISNFMPFQYNTNQYYTVLGENNLTLNNNELSQLDSSSIWTSYITSYFAFTECAKIKEGDFVLITAASSSCGVGAIQMAQALGAKVISVTRSQDKVKKLLEFGSDYAITYDNIEEKVKEIAPNGVNIVYDAVGGSIFNSLANVCSMGATLIIYGVLSKEKITPFPVLTAMYKSLEIKAFVVFKYTSNPITLQQGIKTISELISSGKLHKKSLVGKVFKGIESIPIAHEYLENSKDNFGKIVIEF